MTQQSFSNRSRRPDRASRLRRQVQAAVLALALVATTVVTAQVADAQKVGNPGTTVFTVISGAVQLGDQNVALDPRVNPQCSDGINNDGDPQNPADAQDVLIDWPADPQCTSAADDSEVASGFQPYADATLTGTVAANGAWNIPVSGTFFPPIYIFAAGGIITVNVVATAAGTGNLNPLTGAANLTIPLKLNVQGTGLPVIGTLPAGCGVGPFTLNLTTGTTAPPLPAFPITGTPYSSSTGELKMVDNTFAVPASSGCGLAGPQLDPQFGLPSRAGLNSATLTARSNPKVTKGVNASAVATPSTGIAPLTVSLNGTGSTATKPISSYQWDFTNNGSFDATGPTAVTTYSTPGTYQARLRVTDNEGDFDESIVTVTANEPPNVPPVAAIGSSGTGGEAPYSVTFNGTGSNDPDGSIASYAWDFGNGRTATGATPAAVTYQQPGNYTVRLTVTDNRGATGTTTRQIVVTGAPNVLPSAAIQIVSATGTVPRSVNLSGAGSLDPDGTIVSYNWDLGNGETATGVAAGAVYTVAGSYTVTLTVTDDRGGTATATTVIDVSDNPNNAPSAAISATPSSGTAPLSVTFSGADSSDSDGTIVSYAWTFGNGTFGTGPSPAAVTYALPGSYTATLIVTDNRGATGTSTRVITVSAPPNQTPTAVVTATPTTGAAPLLVRLSSAGSVDPDGAITGYSWNLGNSSTSTSPNPSATYTTPGSYTVLLTVTDNQGASSVQSQTITVLPANSPPTAVIAASRFNGPSPLTVDFNGAGSIDTDGAVTGYAWNFGNGQTATGPLASATFAQGNYTVTLTVTDNRGTSRSTTVAIVAGAPNARPTARLTAVPTSGQAPLLVSFDGSTSSDPDGSVVSWAWDFGNGSFATGQRVQHRYTTVGTFVVRLTVTDNRGSTHSATETVVVDPPPTVRDRVRLQFTGGLSYTFDGATNGTALKVERDLLGITSVNGWAPYTGPGGSSATVTINLSRFLLFPTYGGTVTVNDPANGVNNVTTTLFFASLTSPSATSARGSGTGVLQNPTRNYTLAFTIDDRAS